MNYELAVALKNAGLASIIESDDVLRTLEEGVVEYRGSGRGFFRIGKNGWKDGIDNNKESKIYVFPDLLFLLGACGFGTSVSYNEDKSIAKKGNISCEGVNPSEALGFLYLKLNKR